jgi:hypothetical protein
MTLKILFWLKYRGKTFDEIEKLLLNILLDTNSNLFFFPLKLWLPF